MIKAEMLLLANQVNQAAVILAHLHHIYQNENENWATYKLTEPKLKRLENGLLPMEIVRLLIPLNEKLYHSKDLSITAVKKQICTNYPLRKKAFLCARTLKEYLNKVEIIAKYDLEISMSPNDLVDLKDLLYRKYITAGQLKEAHSVIASCDEIKPYQPQFKAELAAVCNALCFKLAIQGKIRTQAYKNYLSQKEKAISIGLQLSPQKKNDLTYLAIIHYLKGDYEKAKAYDSDLKGIEKYIDYLNAL